MRKCINLPALVLFITFSVQAQNLRADSIAVQKILKEEGGKKAAPGIFTITDKGKVAFIESYIEAKKKAEAEAEKNRAAQYNNALGRRYRKGDATLKSQVLAILKSKDEDKIRELIDELEPAYDDEDKKVILGPEVKEELFKLVSDKNLEKAVVQFLGYNKIDGYIPAFENRLLSGKSIDNGRIFYWLGSDGKSEKAVDYFISKFGELVKEENDIYWFKSGIEDFLESGTPSAKKKLMDFAFAYMEKNPLTLADITAEDAATEILGNGNFNPKLYFIKLILASDDSRVPAFSNALEASFAQHMLSGERKQLHKTMEINLLRFYDLSKKKAAVLELKLLEEDDFMDLVRAVAQDKTLINDKEVAAHLMKWLEMSGPQDKYGIEQFAGYLTDMDREVFTGALEAINSADLRKQLSENYTIETRTVKENNDYLIENGLITKPITEQQIKNRYIEEGLGEIEDYSIYSILDAAGISYNFDVEPGVYPADHDVLMLEFAKHSQGKINGLKVYQQSRYNKKTDSSDIQLLVVYKGKCFVMMPEDFGDWYDMDAFSILLDAIVAESGIKEEFVPVGTGDQTAWYIFGEREKVQQLINDYNMGYEIEEETEE